MNKAKQKYQQKVIRKYVEFFPTETALLNYINERKKEGINFATLVKCLLTVEALQDAINRAEGKATMATKLLLNSLYGELNEVLNDESK